MPDAVVECGLCEKINESGQSQTKAYAVGCSVCEFLADCLQRNQGVDVSHGIAREQKSDENKTANKLLIKGILSGGDLNLERNIEGMGVSLL